MKDETDTCGRKQVQRPAKYRVPAFRFCLYHWENNAGKSSLLQALLLFINGTKLSKTEFYDPDQGIVITAKIEDVTDEVLSKLTEEHRAKIAPM